MTYLEQVLPFATAEQRLELQKLAEQAHADDLAAKRAAENAQRDWDTYEKAQAKATASIEAVIGWLKASGLKLSAGKTDYTMLACLYITNIHFTGNLNCYR
jgi:hypothetical protein